jgi:hypothetical protein
MEEQTRMIEIRTKTRKILNLKCLQKLFKGIVDIACMSKYCTVYFFDTTALIWLKCDMAGPFFICTCSEPADSIKLVVLNQVNNKDLEISSSNVESIKLNDSQNMIYIKMKNGDVRGLWFYEKSELQEIYSYFDVFLSKKTAVKKE